MSFPRTHKIGFFKSSVYLILKLIEGYEIWSDKKDNIPWNII